MFAHAMKAYLVRGGLSLAIVAVTVATVRAEFTPIAGWDKQLFPSFLIATATIRLPDEDLDEDTNELLGDRQGVLGVQIVSPGNDVPVTVTVTSDTILEPSVFTGTLETEGETYDIFPFIKYRYGVLTRNKQSVPVSVTFQVELGEGDDDEDEESEEQTVTLTLRTVNDCPYSVVCGESNVKDVSYVFAAYVNEQHPFVDKILREALDRGVVDSFTGYQSGDPAEVYRQVYALWDALSQRDVRYSNITTSAAESQTVSSQHVRLIDESINNSQANCVDGSVLLASLLRKIDIEPALVYVPGHCYLAFYLDAEKKHLVGVETTLIGSEAGEEAGPDIDDVEQIVGQPWLTSNSWGTFCAAIAMGSEDMVKNADLFNKEDPDYQVVSLSLARQMGILPIAFDSPDKFEANTTTAPTRDEE